MEISIIWMNDDEWRDAKGVEGDRKALLKQALVVPREVENGVEGDALESSDS